MKRAILLARRGEGRAAPNPLVGAVIAKEGRIVGEGYHVFEKRDHAEVVALRQAGTQSVGAALYVTLEPCAHFGRTPPCTDRIIESGIQQVFLAVSDPNPDVTGGGGGKLRSRGILVHEDLCRNEAVRLNESYFYFAKWRRPFARLKLALTLDGMIATRSGDSQWITGEAARREVQRLRYQHDAILVGVNTVLRDNPSLNVRWRHGSRITKVVLDSHLRTPQDARLFDSQDPVIIFHSGGVAAPNSIASRARLIPVAVKRGRLDWDDILDALGRERITSLLIEGGSQVAASALQAGVVQKISFFYGPKIIGGSGLPGVADLAVRRLSQALQLQSTRLRRLGNDFLVEAYLEKPEVARLLAGSSQLRNQKQRKPQSWKATTVDP